MTNPTNDGGAAFPLPDAVYPNGQVQVGNYGMSLRDYFAGQALASAIATLKVQTEDQIPEGMRIIAKVSYLAADAMLAARKQEESK